MRVLFVIRSLELGGAERQCLRLAYELAERSHKILILTLGSGGALVDSIRSTNVEHRALGHRGPANVIRTCVRLRRMFRSFAPDVTYSFMPVSNVLCALSLPDSLRDRLVWGIRAAGFAAGPKGLNWRGRIALHLERALSRVPARIISNSEAAARDHAHKGFNIEKFRVAENVIDTSTFQFDPVRRASRRDAMQVPGERKVVSIVARVDPIKGYECFVDAALGVLQSRCDVEFWCIGGGDRAIQDALMRHIAARGMEAHFSWLGEFGDAAEVAELLMASDLGVSASWSEGFPNSVAEYASCGLRVVATDVGDTRRIVGVHGATVPAGDSNAMAAAILTEIDLPSARQDIRSDFLARFDPGILMNRHESLLREVADGAS